MKKVVSILAALTCVLSLTACGGTTTTIEGEAMSADEETYMVSYGESVVEGLQEVVSTGTQDQYADDAVIKAALQSWENAASDIGEVLGYQDEYAVYSDSKETSVNIGIDGSDHDANVVIVYDQNEGLTSITTNVTYSFGELMEQAALNTVLGMGTTFIVLILLAALIYLFRYIPGLLAGFSKKEEEPAAAPQAAAPAAAAAAAPAASVDHDVLVAIQAAITAYENSQA